MGGAAQRPEPSPALRERVDAAIAAGASGASLAGAGPSVIALTPLDPEPIGHAMALAALEAEVHGEVMYLSPQNYGTRVDVSA